MRKPTRRLIVILGVVCAVGIVLSVCSAWQLSEWGDVREWWGLGLNLGTELVGAVLVYVALELVVVRAEKRDALKRRLLRELGSGVHDVAIAAAEELTRWGWLHDGSLQGANLEGAELEGAKLIKADLRGALLRGANLTGSALIGANLAGAELQYASLGKANLWLANLERARLSAANLESAALVQANLQGADLQEAKLQSANLRHAKYDGRTIWPEDFTPPPEAVKVEE